MLKKAISPIIAWILILGLAVSLAALVYTWYTDQTETMSETILEDIAGSVYCEDVEYDLIVDGDLTLVNTGQRTFTKLKVTFVMLDDSITQEKYEGSWAPQSLINLNQDPTQVLTVQVIPFITVENVEYSCASDRIFEIV